VLEITRGRQWIQSHTVLDSADGPPSDLTVFTSILSQIREKSATRNAKTGYFENRVIATCEIEIVGSVIFQKLSRAATLLLHTGDYLIDIVGVRSDGDESLLDPEPIRVINRPSSVLPADTIPEPISVVIPDFSGAFETALSD